MQISRSPKNQIVEQGLCRLNSDALTVTQPTASNNCLDIVHKPSSGIDTVTGGCSALSVPFIYTVMSSATDCTCLRLHMLVSDLLQCIVFYTLTCWCNKNTRQLAALSHFTERCTPTCSEM